MKTIIIPDLHLGSITQDVSIEKEIYNPIYFKRNPNYYSLRYYYSLYICDNIIDFVKKNKPNKVVFLGDVIDNSLVETHYLDLLSELINYINKLNIPIIVVQGNHDYDSTKNILRMYHKTSTINYIENVECIDNDLYIPYYHKQNDIIKKVYCDSVRNKNYDYIYSHNFVKKSSFVKVNSKITYVDTDELNFKMFFFGHEHTKETFGNVYGLGCLQNTIFNNDNELVLLENNSLSYQKIKSIFYKEIKTNNINDLKEKLNQTQNDILNNQNVFLKYITLYSDTISKKQFKMILDEYDNLYFHKYFKYETISINKIKKENTFNSMNQNVLLNTFFDELSIQKNYDEKFKKQVHEKIFEEIKL